MTTATAPRVTRETLEDRYTGLISGPDDTLVQAADDVLWKLIEGVSRTPREWPGWDSSSLVDDLHELIQEKIVDTIDAEGLAR